MDTNVWKGIEDSETGYSVKQTVDGGYVIAGRTLSYTTSDPDVFIVKTDADGYETGRITLGGGNDDLALDVCLTEDGGFAVVGYTASYGVGNFDVWLMKFKSVVPVYEEKKENRFRVNYQTIVDGRLMLPKNRKCCIYDISGRSVKVGNLKPGIYFIEIDGRISQKVVKIR